MLNPFHNTAVWLALPPLIETELSPVAPYDRIVMPLPKGAELFLDMAFLASKKGTIIHYYDFLHEDELDKAKQTVSVAAKKATETQINMRRKTPRKPSLIFELYNPRAKALN